MRSSAALLVTVLLAVSAVAGVGAGSPADDLYASGDRSESALPVSENAPSISTVAYSTTSTVNDTVSNATARDETQLHVSLRENGNARWNVTAQFVLRNENETAAFRELSSSYENGNADVGPSTATFERIAERAAAETGREMKIENVSRSGHVDDNRSVGVLSLSFTWTNFTQIDERKIVVGDVFWLGSETWLPGLNEDQTLVFAAPDTHQITSASPSNAHLSDGRVLRYEGPQTFGSGDFAVTYSPKNTVTTTTAERFPDLSDGSGLLVLFFLFGVGGVGVYAWSQRRGADPVGNAEGHDGRSPTAPEREDLDRGADADDEADEADDEPVTELLSDEERVLRLLRDNDGRMKQAQIVKETNWSNAKVSQLLSKMSDDGDVDKLRIGRENLITLPDEDVTDTE
jgi:hypothetical protein